MHVDPPTIALIKLRLIQMTRNIMLIINLSKNNLSEKSEMYEFKCT